MCDFTKKEKFEFTPQYNVNKITTYRELQNIIGITRESLNKRIRKYGFKIKTKYTPKESNLILNEKTDIKNWIIKGYRTLGEVCNELHVSQIRMKSLLEDNNIPVVRQQIYLKGYVWLSNSSIEKIKEIIDYKEEERKFTTVAIAERLGIDVNKMREILKKNPVPHGKTHDGHNFYTEENAKKVEEVVKRYYNLKQKKEEANIDAMMKKHPLVKDRMMFNLFYFPDPTPICFQDID